LGETWPLSRPPPVLLHEATARSLFGDAHVDSRLSGWVTEGKGKDEPVRNATAASRPQLVVTYQ
jgi:hypothetical protein